MRSGAVVLKPAKRPLSHWQVQDERDPVLAPPHPVDEELVVSRAGRPLESRRHRQQVSDRDLSLQARAGSALGEEAEDALVDSLDEPPIDGDADQGGNEALGHRSDQMCIVLTGSAVVLLENETASSGDETRGDAAITGSDFPVEVRQHRSTHPHRVGVRPTPVQRGPVRPVCGDHVSRKGPVRERGFRCRSRGDPWAMISPPSPPPPGPSSISQSQ